jgi:tetratricopeptide (TPR) repeat protein
MPQAKEAIELNQNLAKLATLDRDQAVTLAIGLVQTRDLTHAQGCFLFERFQKLEIERRMPEHFALTYAKILRISLKTTQLIDFIDAFAKHHDISVFPFLAIERAWAWGTLLQNQQNKPTEQLMAEILDACQEVIPQLAGTELGWAYRCVGILEFFANGDWLAWFHKAETFSLPGTELGCVLYDKGHCFHTAGKTEQAKIHYNKAIIHFQKDPYYMAWTRNALGLLALQQLDFPQAGYEFGKMAELVKKADAKAFAARAFYGLGSTARLQGDLESATRYYHQAKKASEKPEDHQQSRWGLGQVQRLQGHCTDANTFFTEALSFSKDNAWLYVSLAANALQNGIPSECREYLAKAQAVAGPAATRKAIVEAVLQYQDGDCEAAKLALAQLPQHESIFLEESICLSQFFGQMGLENRSLPVLRRTATVKAAGYLTVEVSGQRSPVALTRKMLHTQLLARLLLAEHHLLSLEQLASALWPKTADKEGPNSLRTNLHKQVEALRSKLIWPDAIRSLGGAYQLNPDAEWLFEREQVQQLCK